MCLALQESLSLILPMDKPLKRLELEICYDYAILLVITPTIAATTVSKRLFERKRSRP